MGYNAFSYCNNNPCRNKDNNATSPLVATEIWTGSMWWLPTVDGPLPIGDSVFLIGSMVLLAVDMFAQCRATSSDAEIKRDRGEQQTTEVKAKITSAPSSPNSPNNRDDKPSLKKIKDTYLKKQGLDAHKIKKEYLGKKAQISHYDLAYDKKTHIIYILKKTGQIAYKTYYYLR